jgi:hypothetical protein
MVAYAIQRLLENEGAIVHVGPCTGTMVFDAVVVDWGWSRRPLVKTLSEAAMPIIAYTSDPAAILKRLPGCRVIPKPTTDDAFISAITDLLLASE